jgi:hypothetical protein
LQAAEARRAEARAQARAKKAEAGEPDLEIVKAAEDAAAAVKAAQSVAQAAGVKVNPSLAIRRAADLYGLSDSGEAGWYLGTLKAVPAVRFRARARMDSKVRNAIKTIVEETLVNRY